MRFAERFGLTRDDACWACGGLKLVADDWDVVEPCAFCADIGTSAAAGFRTHPAAVEITQADAIAAEISQIRGKMDRDKGR